jgi:hypothetical protein
MPRKTRDQAEQFADSTENEKGLKLLKWTLG